MNERADPADVAVPYFHETVLAALPEAVIVLTPEGTITFVNPVAEALFGWKAAEIVGQPVTTLVPLQEGRRVEALKWLARWAVSADPDPSRFLDLPARRRDGQAMPLEVRVSEAFVDGAQRYVIAARDNTARRQEQILLKAENLRAARILLVAEDAIVSIDEDQKIVFFNLAAERMFGWRVEEAVGQPLSLLLPPEAKPNHARHIDAFGASRQASRMMSERAEVKGRRKSGEVFPIEAALTKVRAGGQLTYTAHLRDVTERNAARDALTESERRTRAVFDHAAEAIALLTPDGRVLEINRAGAALAAEGRPVVGAPLWEVPWLGVDLSATPEAGGPLQDAIRRAAAGEAVRMPVELTRAGQPLPIDLRLTPIKDAAGQVAYVLAEGRLEG